jgi:hypothetical protein
MTGVLATSHASGRSSTVSSYRHRQFVPVPKPRPLHDDQPTLVRLFWAPKFGGDRYGIGGACSAWARFKSSDGVGPPDF